MKSKPRLVPRRSLAQTPRRRFNLRDQGLPQPQQTPRRRRRSQQNESIPQSRRQPPQLTDIIVRDNPRHRQRESVPQGDMPAKKPMANQSAAAIKNAKAYQASNNRRRGRLRLVPVHIGKFLYRPLHDQERNQ